MTKPQMRFRGNADLMETSFDEAVCLELKEEDYRERKRYFWLKDEIASLRSQ